MKKLICFLTLSLFIFSSINIFATQLPTDFLATLNQPQNNVTEEQEESDPFSLSFGGNLTTNNIFYFYEEQDLFFENSENLNLWLKFPLSKDYKSSFALEGFYDFSITTTANQPTVISNVLDIPLFKFSFNIPSEKIKSTINLGRFYFADTTGLIFYQNVDGLFTNFVSNKTDFSIFTGYTGLINARNTSYFNNPYDDVANIYALSPKFLVTSARAKFNIFNTQFFNAEFFASVDFGKLDFHKMYTTLTFNGVIFQRLFYILQSTLGMSLKSDGTESLQLANLSKIDLTAYFNFLNSSLSLTGIYASAQSDKIQSFKPITKIDASYIGHMYSSVLKAGLFYTFKPINSLLISLGSDCLSSFSQDDSSLIFDGIQWSVATKYQMLSDIYILLDGLQFISFGEDKPNYFLAGLKLGISF